MQSRKIKRASVISHTRNVTSEFRGEESSNGNPIIYFVEPVRYLVEFSGSGFDVHHEMVIHRYFNSDGGSVPRFAWSIVPPWGIESYGYYLHDWLFCVQIVPWSIANILMRECQKLDNINRIQRNIAYGCVVIGSKPVWNAHTKQDIALHRAQAVEFQDSSWWGKYG